MNETKNYYLEELLEQNRDILLRIEKKLEPKFSTSQNKKSITSFFNETKQLVLKMEQVLPPNVELPSNRSDADTDNLADRFQQNLKMMLRLIPEEKKTKAMVRLPETFGTVINKIITHLKGDDSWLRTPIPSSPPGHSNSYDAAFQLTMEGAETSAKSGGMKPVSLDNSVPLPRDPGYPLEYHNLSDTKELRHILDPLFQLLYTKNTLVSSMKHCKKCTKKSLSVVSGEKLGQNEKGNTTLYKILTDTVISKIFKDDRLISALEQTINIPLLKMAIATALYRLKKKPEKFPELGGVSFFIELEGEMLRSSNISDTLLQLIATPRGAKGIFLGSAAKERGGLDSFLAKDPRLYEKILLSLPTNPDKAKSITEFWTPKFAGLFIIHSKMNPTDTKRFFSPKKHDDINQFIKFHRK